MQLSHAMRAELDRRLATRRREQAHDPAFAPLPMPDRIALAAILGAALLAALLV